MEAELGSDNEEHDHVTSRHRRGTSSSRRGVSIDSISSPMTPSLESSLSRGTVYDHPLDGGHMALSCIAAVLADDPEIWRHSHRREKSRASSNVSRNDSIVSVVMFSSPHTRLH